MGYTTYFEGSFVLNKELDDETYNFLYNLSHTRRMSRNIDALPKSGFEKYGFDSWGSEGEFYVDGSGFAGQGFDISITDNNNPPYSQPSLWCNWEPSDNRIEIVWNNSEKFYGYKKWIKYINEKVLKPRGYVLSGLVRWQGEDTEDFGEIKAEDGKIYVRCGKRSYGDWK